MGFGIDPEGNCVTVFRQLVDTGNNFSKDSFTAVYSNAAISSSFADN